MPSHSAKERTVPLERKESQDEYNEPQQEDKHVSTKTYVSRDRRAMRTRTSTHITIIPTIARPHGIIHVIRKITLPREGREVDGGKVIMMERCRKKRKEHSRKSEKIPARSVSAHQELSNQEQTLNKQELV